MSDAAISTIVTGIITVATMIVGFLTMWVKLRYGANQAKDAAEKAAIVESKIDANTQLAKKIDEQTNGGLEKRLAQIASHAERIDALEATVGGVKAKVDGVEAKVDVLGKNIDATRHEFRGHFGAITQALNSMNILTAAKQPKEN